MKVVNRYMGVLSRKTQEKDLGVTFNADMKVSVNEGSQYVRVVGGR